MSIPTTGKPHAVIIPYPAQGHVNPMMHLAKVLHFKGFHITFIHSEFNQNRLLRSQGLDSLKCLDDFQFETIPDGLPPSGHDGTQDIAELCLSTRKNCVTPFRNLVLKLKNSSDVPPITCIIADSFMTFTLQVADELGIIELVFATMSACGFMGYIQFKELIERGYTPLKDESFLTNGYLDTMIEWVPGMNDVRLRDFPSFVRTTNRDDVMLNFDNEETQNTFNAWGVLINTVEVLEHEVLDALRIMLPRLYTTGSLAKLVDQIPKVESKSIPSNLWKEDTECLDWLDAKEIASVIYVNFGSVTTMTNRQLIEFAWGLANSKQPFLWVVRPDLVAGDAGILPEDFIKATKDRCFLVPWCPQEKVLSHPSVGGFLTHSGWNSTLESICEGVPMLCWPFFGEQPTNCRYVCKKWGIGMEINIDVKKEEVESLVRELMEGEKGKEMRKKAMEWKEKAQEAIEQVGSSYKDLDRLINEVLLSKFHERSETND